MDDTITYIEKNKIGRFLKNVSMAKYTSYKTGGTATLMVFPRDIR